MFLSSLLLCKNMKKSLQCILFSLLCSGYYAYLLIFHLLLQFSSWYSVTVILVSVSWQEPLWWSDDETELLLWHQQHHLVTSSLFCVVCFWNSRMSLMLQQTDRFCLPSQNVSVKYWSCKFLVFNHFTGYPKMSLVDVFFCKKKTSYFRIFFLLSQYC